MKKNLSLNNKGFVLAETLVVAVAISLIFGIVFRNFYPLMGEYERRENYDDIDSKYGTYWIKKLIQSDYNFGGVDNEINNNGFSKFSCNNVESQANKQMCYKLIEKLEVSCDSESTEDKVESCMNTSLDPHIYITKFSMVKQDPTTLETIDVKTKMLNSSELSEDVKTYLRYLPNYSKVNSLNKAQYRIIIEYYRHRFDTPKSDSDPYSYKFDSDNDFKTYATIEVKRE